MVFLTILASIYSNILTGPSPYNYTGVTKALLAFLLVFYFSGAKAGKIEINFSTREKADTVYQINGAYFELKDKRPNPLFHLFKTRHRKNKRAVAAILAFPFPFGIVGLHRIYLGTAPHVPVVYIASLGGVLGILPFIDFFILTFDKEIDRYNENKKVFMWVE